MPKAQVPTDELETLIVQAVRRQKDCQGFQSIALRSSADVHGNNWSMGSADYGTAPPEACKDALASILPKFKKTTIWLRGDRFALLGKHAGQEPQNAPSYSASDATHGSSDVFSCA
jgi:hypothetical protein